MMQKMLSHIWKAKDILTTFYASNSRLLALNNVKGKSESNSLIITGREEFVLIYHGQL
jgi:hypothetical protein